MRYIITKNTLDFIGQIDINKEEYNEIKDSIRFLSTILQIEETFDILIENYFEYEMSLMNASFHNILHIVDKDFLNNAKLNICRRIANLFSSFRMYLDHTKHHLSSIYGKKSQQYLQFEENRKFEYDTNLSYRIIEELRNYSQHRGYPIYGFTLEAKRHDTEQLSDLHYSTTPYIITSEFENDKKFKKSVYKEMKRLSDKINLKILLREYIESLGKIHEKLRGLLKTDIGIRDKAIFNVIGRFIIKFGKEESIIGLVIAQVDSKDNFLEKINIIDDLTYNRKQFESKNRNLINFKARIVTSNIS